MRKEAVDMMDVEEQQVDEKTAAENRQFSNNSVVIIMAVIFSALCSLSFIRHNRLQTTRIHTHTACLYMCTYKKVIAKPRVFKGPFHSAVVPREEGARGRPL